MRFVKTAGYLGPVRQVWSEDRTHWYGFVGRLRDFWAAGLVDYQDLSGGRWLYLPGPGLGLRDHLGRTRAEALEELDKTTQNLR